MTEGIEGGLRRLAAFLTELGRPAAIIGGVAVIARVGTRATRDVDVVIGLHAADVDRVLDLATRHGYAFDPNDREIFAEGLIRLWPIVDGPRGFGADLIFADVPFLERVVARATSVDLAGVSLPVAQLEDLVVLKLEAGRPVDIEDVFAIRDAFAASLDLARIRSEAALLGLIDRVDLYLGPG
ncbi:MAG: hypothetical protein HYV07_15355 [Deltaproteobacteria bacterium]|nr:hypothetical protein [Deltaproteobacteria bacterium]